MFLISRATQKQAIIYGKHVYHFLFLQWLFLKGVVLPGRWACFFDVKSIKSERLQSHLFDRLPKKSDWTILWESRNTSVICSDLSIAKIAWNHRRGACFFMVSLKSLRINHHYSMSFAEERLYSPLYLRVCFSMSRRHKTRFFLIMLEWKTALRPPVKRKNCSWAASTWCSAFNPWEVIASDSSFFPARSDPPENPRWFLLYITWYKTDVLTTSFQRVAKGFPLTIPIYFLWVIIIFHLKG